MVNERLTATSWRRRSLLRNCDFLRALAVLLPRLLDHLRQAAGEPARADRRAAVDAGGADRLDRPRLVGPGLLLLAGSARPVFLRQAVALALGAPGADHDLVVGRAGA